jgi:hypothetical protein
MAGRSSDRVWQRFVWSVSWVWSRESLVSSYVSLCCPIGAKRGTNKEPNTSGDLAGSCVCEGLNEEVDGLLQVCVVLGK